MSTVKGHVARTNNHSLTTQGVPNIRIQVNNENLQNPPYLLKVIEQVEAMQANGSLNADSAASQAPQASYAPKSQFTANTTNRLEPAVPSAKEAPQQPQPDGAATSHEEDHHQTNTEEALEPHSFSVVKEETIEEILDLDPDSVLKLSPESIISGVSPADYSKMTDTVAAETSNNHQEYASLDANANNNNQGFVRKPQLPVTNSHLKKPAEKLDEDDSLLAGGLSGLPVPVKNSGAKSLVSPSVAADEPPAQGAADLQKKMIQPPPPDTWEPSQVMNGVTNASLVPATVNKEYGSQTRTRITLGGGYVRDRLPPLVNPASSSYQDYKPEKPVTPLEKPHIKAETREPVEVSRVIEVPEKIFIPSSNKGMENQSYIGKPDSRCAKRGVMTFEHPTACDKYFYCEDGYLSEQTCPNGLMYGTRDMVTDYCVHRWKVSCEDKSVPNPISSPGCRWQYGIFNVQGSPKCSPDFYECTEGKFEVKKCSIDGQVYDDRTKSCRFAEQVGCTNEALADFHCPPDDQGNTYWPFPRYFLNERALIHCVNDKPEIVRCTELERVDPEHLHCVPMAKLTNNAPAGDLAERKARERKKTVVSR